MTCIRGARAHTDSHTHCLLFFFFFWLVKWWGNWSLTFRRAGGGGEEGSGIEEAESLLVTPRGGGAFPGMGDGSRILKIDGEG